MLSHVVHGNDRVPVHVVDDLLALLMSLSSSPELQQVLGLDLEQAALDGGGAARPP